MTKFSNGHAPKFIISASSKLQVRENLELRQMMSCSSNQQENQIGWISQVFCWLRPGSSGNFKPLLKFGQQQTPGLPREPELRGASEAGTSWSSRSLGRVFFSGQRVSRSWKDGLFSFPGGLCDFYCLIILGGITVFFPNKTRKNREFFEVCKLGSLQRKKVSLWMLEGKKLLK